MPLEFEIVDLVMLKVSPMKYVRCFQEAGVTPEVSASFQGD